MSKKNKHNSDDPSHLSIEEFNFDLIRPSTINDPENRGGSKIFFIGKPGSGKSSAIKSLFFHKKHIIPVAQVFSGTEDFSTPFYGKFIPPAFIFDSLKIEAVESCVKKRQQIAKKYLNNPWCIQLIDDCTEDPKIFSSPLFQAIFKLGRHWKLLEVISLQYAVDLKPNVRTLVDGSFIFREPSAMIRKKIYENYCPSFISPRTFNILMDEITEDHRCIYIHNMVQSNNPEDCIFWYKADMDEIPQGWRFGCEDYWNFSDERYDRNYSKSLF